MEQGMVYSQETQSFLRRGRWYNKAMKEIWRNIKGYEGLYQVSSFGVVRSVDRIEKHKTRWGDSANFKHKGRLIALKKCAHLDKNGKPSKYVSYSVGLSKDGAMKWYSIHRLVAEAFVPNHKNLPCVNHRDSNTLNNRADNLEWCTYSQNSQHMFRNGRASGSVRTAKAVANSKGEIFDSINDAARHYKRKWLAAHISECCRGVRKTAFGLEWRYA